MKKRFLLKFLFVFDLAVTQTSLLAEDEDQEDGMKRLQSSTQLNLDAKQIEVVIQSLVETLTKLICLDFMKVCSSDELKVVFYSIWNLAFEAKSRGLVKES